MNWQLFFCWRFICRIGLILVCVLPLDLTAAPVDLRAGCDSCRFQVDSLDRPFSVIGTWLFTRDDTPRNKDVVLDTTAWRLVKTPGPWKKIYGDGNNFAVGWYRGVFEFAPSIVGQEVVLLVDPYMARANIYVDGAEVFRRPGDINLDRYYSIQPIPVRFKVSQSRHVVTMRIDTQLMTGIYQLPFELRRYDAHDVSLVWYQYQGAEMRLIAASVTFAFGLFFLLIFWKTRYGLYLFAALTSLAIAPFFIAPTDYLLRIFSPEVLYFLHYPGLIFGFFVFRFSQYFHVFTPRINWVSGLLFTATSLIIGSMAVYPNPDLFQPVRVMHLFLLLLNALGTGYMFVNGVLNKKRGAGILLIGMLMFLATGINDILLATGNINSVGTMVTGVFAFVSALLFVASNNFANTFRENARLVVTLSSLNENLESMVTDRTRELDKAIQGLGAANDNLSASYEQLKVAKDELVRSEKLAALGSLVAGIAHELNTPIGNGLMAITSLRDELKSFKTDVGERGLRRSAFDTFLNTVESASDITGRNLHRSAELVSSFKQIAADQTTSNRRQFELQKLVGETVSILQSMLSKTLFKIDNRLEQDTTRFPMDSFPGALVQVLTNLINNAVIHGFDRRDHGIISIFAEVIAPGYVMLHVKDDGKGITGRDLPRIFDPFFTTKLGHGGSGLGLHVSHNAVTQILGGTLKVSSQPGVGTEFVLTLPFSAPVTTEDIQLN